MQLVLNSGHLDEKDKKSKKPDSLAKKYARSLKHRSMSVFTPVPEAIVE